MPVDSMLMNVKRDLTMLNPANNQKVIYCDIF